MHADVTSQNIVGFQQIKLEKGWSLFSVTFKDVSGEKYSLDDIIVCDASGTPIDKERTVIAQMCKINQNGSGAYEDQLYSWKKYSEAKGLGWYRFVATKRRSNRGGVLI